MWRVRETLAVFWDIIIYGDFWEHLDAWAGVMSQRIRPGARP
jgi:hypothetical protein